MQKRSDLFKVFSSVFLSLRGMSQNESLKPALNLYSINCKVFQSLGLDLHMYHLHLHMYLHLQMYHLWLYLTLYNFSRTEKFCLMPRHNRLNVGLDPKSWIFKGIFPVRFQKNVFSNTFSTFQFVIFSPWKAQSGTE